VNCVAAVLRPSSGWQAGGDDLRHRDEIPPDWYDAAVRESWIAKELKLVQNAEPMVAKFGGDVDGLVPEAVLKRLRARLSDTMGSETK
jgi:hypothetical protein